MDVDFLNELGRRLWMLLRRKRFGADLEEEMRLHLELRQQDLGTLPVRNDIPTSR
jgi:hypothetical protein